MGHGRRSSSGDLATTPPATLNANAAMSVLFSEQYQVSHKRGFLPDEEPLQRLPPEIGGGWEAVEACFDIGQAYTHSLAAGGVGRGTDEWRESVRQLISPQVEVLATLPLLRRAHVLLSFLGHMYLHSTFPSTTTVPNSIASTWVQVSERLGLPPILTYADTVLWNWRLLDPRKPFQADNLAMSTTFTSTESEYGFYLLSLLSELLGPSILRSIATTLDLCPSVTASSLPLITSHLSHISTQITALAKVLQSATDGSFGPNEEAIIVPECFYREVRPWFNGGKWTYEGVKGEDGSSDSVEFDFGGPSAGQSSLVHVIDLFLGVDHSPRKPLTALVNSTSPKLPTSALPSVSAAPSRDPPSRDATFMSRMSFYMPAPHRALLAHLSLLQRSHLAPLTPSRALERHSSGSLRQLVQSPLGRSSPDLIKAYDAAVDAMKTFRDMHMRLVGVFIISPSKKAPSEDSVFWAEWERQRREKEGMNGSTATVKEEVLKGTGGTALVSFLRNCRRRTIEALLG